KNKTRKFFVTASIVDNVNNAGVGFRLAINTTGAISIEDEDSDDVFVGTTGASARTVTIRGAGTLAVTVDNSDKEVDKTKNILSNTTSPFVASYEFTATNEPVKVEDLQLVASGASGSSLANVVSEVILYAND